MDKPIAATEIRTVYEGRIFSVQTERIRLPKGGELTVEIVRHPGSVVIIPLTAHGEIILVRQYRHAVGRWVWELPAGSLKPGEDIQRAALRECHEEIGLVAERLDALGAFFPTPGYCDEEMHFFRASALRAPGPDENAQQDEDEDIEARPFTADRLREMIAAGEIVDLKTLAGLALNRS